MKRTLLFLGSLILMAGVFADFVEHNGAKIFYKRAGESFFKTTPLIVIHGGPGLTQDYLLPQMLELAKDNFVVFYDQRGCGNSSGEIGPETISMDAFISDIEALRKALHFEKVSILGHSWGGLVAMHYAVAHPDHVDKLILSNSLPPSSEGMALFMKEWMHRMQPYQAKLAQFHANPGFEKGDPSLIEEMHKMMFRTYLHNPEKADLLHLRMSQEACVNGAKIYEIFRKSLLSQPFNLHPQLQGLKIDTLILHGDSDIIPSITAQNIHENIPHSKYVLMKNCGHFPYVEDPDTYFSLIHEFLLKK